MLGLVGESGSGKSTTAKAIVRLVDAQAGGVRLNGVDLLSLRGEALKRARRSVQMVFQDPYSSVPFLGRCVQGGRHTAWLATTGRTKPSSASAPASS